MGSSAPDSARSARRPCSSSPRCTAPSTRPKSSAAERGSRPPMHPRIAELLEHLDRERAALRSSVDAIPSELRARRPAPERWSVAEVLEHLGRVERGLTRLFVTRLEEARTRGLGPERETGPVLPTFDMARARDRTRPVTA